MNRAQRAAAILLALPACAAPTLSEAGPKAHAAGSQCRTGERIVYSCRFGSKVGSVCLGTRSVHYRFGARGRAEIDIASTPDWSNIHLGGNRSQAGLNQDHIRFTNGDNHYVVHAGATGSLNERPGYRTSGISVLRGASGEEDVADLHCRTAASFDPDAFASLGGAAPEGWEGREDDGGPFDAIY